jgi:hypothetical protein
VIEFAPLTLWGGGCNAEAPPHDNRLRPLDEFRLGLWSAGRLLSTLQRAHSAGPREDTLKGGHRTGCARRTTAIS